MARIRRTGGGSMPPEVVARRRATWVRLPAPGVRRAEVLELSDVSGPQQDRRRRRCLRRATSLLLALAWGSASMAEEPAGDPGLTAVQGLRVGQFTYEERPTGCTVVLAMDGAVGGVDVRGGAPATREIELLRPHNMVQTIHGVVLSGGSAYGLDAAGGVMRYLEEQDVGFRVSAGVVPIVAAASLMDLGIGGSSRPRPDAECGYRAAGTATTGPVAQGNVGAGAGATVGKMGGREGRMKGGVGSASISLVEGRYAGLVVAALVAVNAIGDIVDPSTGQVVAGVRGPGNELLDARKLLREGRGPARGAARREAEGRENTTIAVVATNARLTQAEATRVAQMAHDGLARSIVPSHTPGDGDTVFALATGRLSGPADVSRIGALAAEALADAVLAAVRKAESLPGIPAVRDLPGGSGAE